MQKASCLARVLPRRRAPDGRIPSVPEWVRTGRLFINYLRHNDMATAAVENGGKEGKPMIAHPMDYGVLTMGQVPTEGT